jgi:hypothetical protein
MATFNRHSLMIVIATLLAGVCDFEFFLHWPFILGKYFLLAIILILFCFAIGCLIYALKNVP